MPKVKKIKHKNINPLDYIHPIQEQQGKILDIIEKLQERQNILIEILKDANIIKDKEIKKIYK